MKILIIAPHPDDEVLGCGGTIAKYGKKGDEVHLCIVTKAYTPDWSEEFLKKREEEIAQVVKLLGIKKTYFLDFPTVRLDTIPQQELMRSILKIIETVKPNTVYVPHWGDPVVDHRLVFEAASVATRPRPGSTVKKLLSYEILSETEWGKGFKEFIPDIYEDITLEIKVKMEAMKAYRSELKEFPHPRSLEAIETLAKKRGSEAGLKFAEAFMLIREINH